MKLLTVVFAGAMVVSASEPRVAPKPGVAPKPAAAPRVAPRLTIPKDAVEAEPGSFHYTDAQGKKWIYRQTPFGVARLPAPDGKTAPESQPATVPDPSAGVKATPDGDTIHFERPSPFGVYRWEKNKSDLTEMEQAVWTRELARNPAR
jgi:hypothetical protein